MVTNSRQVVRGETINLEIDLFDVKGNKVDADTVPEVQIVDSLGNELRSFSNSNVVRIQQGRYRLAFMVPDLGSTGVWVDNWRAVLNGFTTSNQFHFIVLTQAASIEVAGAAIGDDPNINYSEAEICGINILMHQLRCRLNDYNLKATELDAYGNKVLVDCPIFDDAELLCFLVNSLSEFNQTPHFTALGFDSPIIYERNANVIVEGAHILAMAARMLVEAGREFNLTDNGITLVPPPLSTTLNNELGHFLNSHIEKLKQIKWSMKPAPIGFGSFRVLATNPNFLRLRHLRARRII